MGKRKSACYVALYRSEKYCSFHMVYDITFQSFLRGGWHIARGCTWKQILLLRREKISRGYVACDVPCARICVVSAFLLCKGFSCDSLRFIFVPVLFDMCNNLFCKRVKAFLRFISYIWLLVVVSFVFEYAGIFFNLIKRKQISADGDKSRNSALFCVYLWTNCK